MKNYKLKKLSNGIKVYLYSDKTLKRTFASYNVEYGSCGIFNKFYYDGKEYTVSHAMAHFLEHLLIEHSKFGNGLHHFMDKNYSFNGITYSEMTCYYFLGVDDTKNSIKELIEMIDCPVFTEKDIEETKAAVCEELKKNLDSKIRILGNCSERNLYANIEQFPDNFNSLGTVESTQAIDYDMTKLCYDAYYHTDNKFLVIGGNFDEKEMIEYLEEIYTNIKEHPNKMEEYKYSDEFKVRKELEIIEMPTDSDMVQVSYKMHNIPGFTPLQSCLYFDLYVALKYSESGPFIQEEIKKRNIVNGIGTSSCFEKDDTFFISFMFDSYKRDEFIKNLENSFNTSDLDRHKFELLKRNSITSELNKKDFMYSCFSGFTPNYFFSKNISDVDVIQELTYEKMIDFINKFDYSNRTVTVITNKKMN